MLVSNRGAVLKAMQEFDDLGRDAFLTKYNFGKAREFFLFHDGKFYDSKAIVNRAHGIEAGDDGVLAASEFSGGEDTVQKSLNTLGFTVVRTRLPDSQPAGDAKAVLLTWNPQRWQWTDRDDVASSVSAGEPIQRRWSCGNTNALPIGTRAFVLRQGEEPRGIVASGWTVAVPFEEPHWDAELAAKGETAHYIRLAFDAVLPEVGEPVDPRAESGPLSAINWAIPRSGTSISGKAYEALELLWASRQESSLNGARWTRPELTASVEAYIEMLQKMRDGQKFVKTEYYHELKARFGRTEKAFEYRMQNISYVFSLLGRQWVSGLPPARNVGASVAAEIESILAEIEERPVTPDFAFDIQVKTEVAKGKVEKPSGNKTPKKVFASATGYERDPKVKAWVLIAAGGSCECCRKQAPFVSIDGSPFLEVHHIRRLADAGPDVVENAVALCPNCHRELHHGAGAPALAKKLFENVTRLRPS